MSVTVLLAGTEELKEKAFSIRQEVFVVEQKVNPSDEFDQYESESRHFLAVDANEQPAGAARWRYTDKGIKLERFAVKKEHRKKGIASKLVQMVLEDIVHHITKEHLVYLHSQVQAVALYKKFGFRKSGDLFIECDIEHYLMSRSIEPGSVFC